MTGSTDNPPLNKLSTYTMPLPSRICAETVEEICQAMREAQLSRFREVTLDFAQVDIFTTPGMQLLLALEKSLQEAGSALTLDNVKTPVGAVMREMGFERFIQIH